MTFEMLIRHYHGCRIDTQVTHSMAPDSHEVHYDNLSIGIFHSLAEAIACAKEKNPPPAPESIVEDDEDDIDTDLFADKDDDGYDDIERNSALQ